MHGCRYTIFEIQEKAGQAALLMGLTTSETAMTIESALKEARSPANPRAFRTAGDRVEEKSRAQQQFEREQLVIQEDQGAPPRTIEEDAGDFFDEFIDDAEAVATPVGLPPPPLAGDSGVGPNLGA